MSALARNPDWWRDLELAEPQKQPQKPTLIITGTLVTFDDLEQLACALVNRLDGRDATLIRSVASYEGFDTFPAFSVHAKGPPGPAGGPAVDTYVGCVAVQKTKAEDLLAAIATAQQLLRAA